MQVEKLIKVLPSAPSDWQNEDANSLGRSSVNDENSTQQDGTTMRETQSMLLERIASEMNRLKFYMAHAQVSIMHLLLFFFAKLGSHNFLSSTKYRLH